MSSTTLNQLVAGIGGAHVTAFFIVLARVTPLFMFAPLFSSRIVPKRVRGIVAIALAVGLTPVATHGQTIPGAPLEVLLLIVQSLLVGMAFAFVVGTVFTALHHAGAIIDGIAGFGFGGMVDPVNGSQAGVLTQVYSLVGMVIFIAIGGDAWTLRGLSRTFDIVPVTRAPRLGPLVAGASGAVSQIFLAAIELAAPAMLALMITDVAFGMVSKVVPQLNVFAVGFPVKVGVALLIVAATLPFVGGWLSDQLTTSVGSALHTLKVA